MRIINPKKMMVASQSNDEQLKHCQILLNLNDSGECEYTFHYPKYIGEKETVHQYTPLYSIYDKAEMYKEHGVKYLDAMNAKEVQDEEKQNDMFNSSEYILEDKLDGTRALMHFNNDPITGEPTTRVFSRRMSVKTGWLSENTDSLPQFSLMTIPELSGTVIDGEMRMPNYEFKEVSSTLNCNWDKAVQRQFEYEFIHLNVFDILFFKGKDLRDLPLTKRKAYLREVVDIINDYYIGNCIDLLPYYPDVKIDVNIDYTQFNYILNHKETYINLFNDLQGVYDLSLKLANKVSLSRRSYYEFIVAFGGEGVMLKPKNGIYECGTRKNNFLKVKKFITRECVILDFTPPTKEYKGKFPDPKVWRYWESFEGDIFDTSDPKQLNQVISRKNEVAPVSKYYAENWVGNIVAGVVITDSEISKLPKKCLKDVVKYKDVQYLIVAEISGYDEETREYFTKYKDNMIGEVVEIKANAIFTDTGRLRHPRFLRLRPDKLASQCTFADHINFD